MNSIKETIERLGELTIIDGDGSQAISNAIKLIEKYQELKGNITNLNKLNGFLEGYKFPIMTATNEYGDSDKVTREEFFESILKYLESTNDK